MSFDAGILHLTNWLGNVIMPTLAAWFVIAAIVQFAKGHEASHSTYGAMACLLVSGLLRAMEAFAAQRGFNDPDRPWISLLTLINYTGNVILPLYAALQVAAGVLKVTLSTPLHPTTGWLRHAAAAGLCMLASGFIRLLEFFVQQGSGGLQ